MRPVDHPGARRALALGGLLKPARAQWTQTHEQFYRPAEHNWVFRRNYPAADRLFNAFDYGHAILYEELYTQPNAPASRLEEVAIEVQYVKLAPEAKQMFEWAHILASPKVSREKKREEILRAASRYRDDTSFVMTEDAWRQMSLAMVRAEHRGLGERVPGGLPRAHGGARGGDGGDGPLAHGARGAPGAHPAPEALT